MIVRKFEARSMKEALDLVKKEFGPEAIILQVKDHSQRFGLLGQGSVEISAAISEEALERKKIAEQKLPENKKQQFYNQPAKQQKEWVYKLLESYKKNEEGQKSDERVENRGNQGLNHFGRKGIYQTQPMRYIDITDDEPIFNKHKKVEAVTEAKNENNHAYFLRSTGQKDSEVGGGLNHLDVVEDLKKEIFDLKKVIWELHQGRSAAVKESGLPPAWLFLKQKMLQSGLTETFVEKLLSDAVNDIPVDKQNLIPFVEAWLMNWLQNQVRTVYPTGRVHIFIGAPGAGKTHLLLKWAAFLRMRENKKLLLVNADHRKMGANNQLRTFANILGVSFARLSEPKQWSSLLEEDVDNILCDTFPIRLDDPRSLEELVHLCRHAGATAQKHFIVNASSSVEEQKKWLCFAKSIRPDSLSFTHVDESSRRGGIFERSYELGIPLFSLSFDPGVSSGFELVTAERLIDFILLISKNPLANALSAS